MSQQPEIDYGKTDQELQELFEDLVGELAERPITMSDLDIKVPDTMEFGEFVEEFGGDTFVEAFHGLSAEM